MPLEGSPKSFWDSGANLKALFYLISFSYLRNFPVGWIRNKKQNTKTRKAEKEQDPALLRVISGRAVLHIYHRPPVSSPDLINCISCQRRTLKVTAAYEKVHNNHLASLVTVLPAEATQIIGVIHKEQAFIAPLPLLTLKPPPRNRLTIPAVIAKCRHHRSFRHLRGIPTPGRVLMLLHAATTHGDMQTFAYMHSAD